MNGAYLRAYKWPVIRLGLIHKAVLTESDICLGSRITLQILKMVLLLLTPSKYIPSAFPLS